MFQAKLEYITYPHKNEYSPSDYIIGRFRTESSNVPAKYRNGKQTTVFSAKGTGIPTEKKFDILLEGKWNFSEKYGLELLVNKSDISTPEDSNGIKLYLQRFLTGCGVKTAEKIYKKFGQNTLFVLNNEPKRLLEVPGITETKLRRMLKNFNSYRQYQDLSLLLADYRVSKNSIETINSVLGEDAVKKIKENPFILEKFRGFGFDMLDTMSIRFGCNPSEPLRIKSAIKSVHKLAMRGAKTVFSDKTLQTGGNLYINQYTMRAATLTLLNHRNDSKVSVDQVTKVICDMAKEHELMGENGNSYLCDNYIHENKCAQYIVDVLLYSNCKRYTDEQIGSVLPKAEKFFGINLSNNQKKAVKMALQNSVSVITGGAGTGKTTVLKVFLECLRELGENVERELTLAAPTGKAAIRMTESTAYPASTIHKALGLVGEVDFYKTEDQFDSLNSNIIICDEFSMSDQFLAYRLFAAAPRSSCRILLCGDVGQLPSVGAGRVLNDIIESGVVPVTMLNVIFRQASESNIIKNSHNIYEGKKDIDFSKDFLITKENMPENIAQIVVNRYLELCHKYGKDEVIVLSPVTNTGGVLAVPKLNSLLQQAVNPPFPTLQEHSFHGCLFREGDKVMNLKNKVVDTIKGDSVDVCNGDTGTIKKIKKTTDGWVCQIDFSFNRRIEFDMDDMNDITLAYACTIHKAQGSEWLGVIMPMSSCFPKTMLTRNLIYTGITRAREMVHIVGEEKVLLDSIDNIISIRRNTALSFKIKKFYDIEKE